MKIAKMEATYLGGYGSDLTVANAARVSFNKGSGFEWWDSDGRGPVDSPSPCGAYFNIPKLSGKDAKLIQYLATHKHFSPFNHSFISFRIKAPLFCARQLVKHKFMPWNEVSRRYVDEEPEFYMPDKWRDKALDKKQGSGDGTIEKLIIEGAGSATPDDVVSAYVRHSLFVYNTLLANNVAPEQARMVLPVNMMTEWIWSGTLGAYADMLRLRLDPHTQEESREVAQMILEQLRPIFPVSLKALLNVS
jgi:thymidylate synthase (FAD)